VAGERRARILSQLVGSASPALDAKRLCEVTAEIVGVSGASIMLMGDEVPHGSLCASNPVSALIAQLQYTLGEGPSLDAYQQGRPVVEADLAAPVTPRWPAFSEPALEAGVRAVFGFPLRVGAVRLGTVDLYCNQPSALTIDQHDDAMVMADIAAETVIGLQANAPAGQLVAELEAGSDFKYVVHQAAGMVAVQLGVSVGQALVRLRAYAFSNDRSLADVARDVVARELRFGEPNQPR
jgi:hypothetical protein